MPRSRKQLSDELVYAICERFLGNELDEKGRPWTADTIAKWVTKQGHEITRERIFPTLRKGLELGFVKLSPPQEFELLGQLASRFPNMPADTRVLNVRPPYPLINENVCQEAANVVCRLVLSLGAKKKRNRESSDAETESVHIGFSAGGTSRRVAELLAQRLRSEAACPQLTIHALSSGFATNNPLAAPVAFFSYFSELNVDLDFVGLFSPAVVKSTEYENTVELTEIKRAFTEGEKIDIVVTSLAKAGHKHGLLNRLFDLEGVSREDLERVRHRGDVLWSPYSPDGPITEGIGVQAMTIFNLDQLRGLAEKEGKHVVLVAGTCVRCGDSKAAPLLPLLSEPLLKVCNHLILDSGTARELIRESS